MSYLPWGKLSAILSRLDLQGWDVIGALGTEDRCIEVPSQMASSARSIVMWEIVDFEDTVEHQTRRAENESRLKRRTSFMKVAGRMSDSLSQIRTRYRQMAERQSENVIFDITSFPKTYFFPILKYLISEKGVKNLLVTYTKGLTYASEELSDDPLPWMPIQPFVGSGNSGEIEFMLVGVGFEPFNLPELIKDQYRSKRVRYLYPIPPGPPTYQRAMSFLKIINDSRVVNRTDVHPVSIMNTPAIYQLIGNIAKGKQVLLAPYGAKTMSLAMALYACRNDCPVYYTQPKYYHPAYTSGIGGTTAYLLVHNGEDLYA